MASELQHYRRVHFIAIGGISMSALAGILLDRGFTVSGSDRQLNHLTDDLAARGAAVFQGHAAEQLGDAQLVVYSSAIRAENPELKAARERGIPVWHRADLLGALLQDDEGIGVTGSHGKTTTSSLLTQILLSCGQDPTAILGGELPLLGGNSHSGRGNYTVAEVDESDGSMLKLRPRHTIVTNIEADHLDHYGTLQKIEDTFVQYLCQLPSQGLCVLGIDGPHARRLLERPELAGRRLITCASEIDADYRAVDIRSQGEGSLFSVLRKQEGTSPVSLGDFALGMPGRYNVQNALYCIALLIELGFTAEQIRPAMQSFHGPARRFQRVGERGGIRIIDDYAHHPTELSSALRAARELAPQRLVAVFQPHLYSRTRFLLDQFAVSFMDADLLVLTDIYGSREDPEPGVNGELLYRAVQERDAGRKVFYHADKHSLADFLLPLLQPGDLVLMLGAGDINRVAAELSQKL